MKSPKEIKSIIDECRKDNITFSEEVKDNLRMGTKFLFDQIESDIFNLPGDIVSVIIPSWKKENSDYSRILRGKIISIKFKAGNRINEYDMNFETTHTVPKNLLLVKFNQDGLKLMKTEPAFVKLLLLDKITIKLETEIPNNVFLEISKLTGDQNMSKSLSEIEIPARWITHNHTSNPDKPVINSKRFPFPGTRFHYKYGETEKTVPCMVLESFLKMDEIYVRCQIPNTWADMEPDIDYNGMATSIIRFSGLTKNNPPSSMGCLNVTSPISYKWIRDHPLISIRKIIRNRMFSDKESHIPWNLYKVRQFKVQIDENDSSGKWVDFDRCIGNPEYQISSLIGGIANLDGQDFKVVPSYHNIQEDEVCICDLDNSNKQLNIKSLLFNKCIGDAFLVDNKSPNSQKLFFSTHNNVSIDLSPSKFFNSTPINSENSIIDAISLNNSNIIGYSGNSKQKGHESQKVVYWNIPSNNSLYTFYTFVKSMGHDNMFENQNMSRVRKMMESEEYPELIDAFNLLCYGLSEYNPTINSDWTLEFKNFYLFDEIPNY